MTNEQMEIEHITKWSKVLTIEAYGILLDKVINKRKIKAYYHSPYDGLTASEIDNIVIEIMYTEL